MKKKIPITSWQQLMFVVGGAKELAKTLGIERNTVSSWHVRRNCIPMQYWQKIRDVYGITSDELLAVSISLQNTPK